MKKHYVFYFSLLIISSLLIGCSNKLSVSSNKGENSNQNKINKAPTDSSKVNNIQNNLPKNILQEKIPEAENTPHMFYQFINEKRYDEANSLLCPAQQGYGENLEYMKNIKHVEILDFKDISNVQNYTSLFHADYFAVKYYYAKLNFVVNDVKLTPRLAGVNLRIIGVGKEKSDSNWKIIEDMTSPTEY